jgi:hypothetical protein
MKKVILMLSAGRSGTAKLANNFSLVPGVYSEHEGNPGFDTVRLANQADPSVGLEFVRRKLEYYESLPQQTIVHTGHMAGEGFIEHFVAAGAFPSAIILRRPKREVALSMYRLHWIPGKNENIRPWYCGPDEPGVLPYPDWKTAHAYQLCYWWCLDTERRVRQYAPICQSVYETTLTDILDVSKFNQMLAHFKLPSTESIPQHKDNNREVLRLHQLDKPNIPSDFLTELEQEVIDATQTFQMLGPDEAHLITPSVALNTIKSLSFSVRKSETQLTGYVKALSLEM